MKVKKKIKLDYVMVLLLVLLSFNGSAQEGTVELVNEGNVESLGNVIFNYSTEIILIVTILLILWAGLSVLKKGQKAYKDHSKVQDTRTFGEKLMDFLGGKNTEEEIEQLDLHHDYDGISELDNSIPAWWNLAFLGTIIFAVVYLIRIFITGGIPDQVDELKESQRIAAIKVEQYLANSANNIDENSVVMLDDTGISNGKVLYDKSCVACHGEGGSGGIGPNLADEYWLHGGSINDIFYSIKYGWPDKGMIAWKDQFSPLEIAEISSYIKSIQGTTPLNPKEAEGDLYKEN